MCVCVCVCVCVYMCVCVCINSINNDVTSADILQDKDNFVFVVGNIFVVKC